jgi:ribose transport system ATP-binding protein
MTNEIRLSARGISKHFGGTVALSGVDLDLYAGEMLGLVVANGAGKSTLVKIICGAFTHDEGTISVDGRPVRFDKVADALAAGIAVAHQQVAIIPCLTGAQNILLGHEPVRGGIIDAGAVRRQAKEFADRFGVAIDLGRECSDLDPGETKILDILKAMASHPRVLILDEPTAQLTLAESRRLFAFLDDLKRHGVSILFITHHLNEVFDHCDRVAVLKDGRKVHDGLVSELQLHQLVHIMVGRVVEDTDWTSHASTDDRTVHLESLHMSRLFVPELTIHRGEVVGLAGVLGAGQIELLERLAGVPHPAAVASARLGRLSRLPHSVEEAIEHGIYFIADNRLRKALFPRLSVEENILVGSLKQASRNGFMQRSVALNLASEIIQKLRVKCSDLNQEILSLSGGNQQKVVFGRWLARLSRRRGDLPPPLMLLANPTEGVDVGSKAELYAVIRELARGGAAVLVTSTEFDELIKLCDRVYCIAHGVVKTCVPRTELAESRLLLEVN